MTLLAVMQRNVSTENTLEASTTHIPACICIPADFSPDNTASVVQSVRKWEGCGGVGCARGGGVLAAIEFEQPDQGTGMQHRPQCSRAESMAIPKGSSGIGLC